MLRLFIRAFLLTFSVFVLSCGKTTESDSGSSSSSGSNTGTGSGTSAGGCGSYNGHQLYKGSDGGCYYINSNGNKTYVERSKCNC